MRNHTFVSDRCSCLTTSLGFKEGKKKRRGDLEEEIAALVFSFVDYYKTHDESTVRGEANLIAISEERNVQLNARIPVSS